MIQKYVQIEYVKTDLGLGLDMGVGVGRIQAYPPPNPPYTDTHMLF